MIRLVGVVLAAFTLLLTFQETGQAGSEEPKRWTRKMAKSSDVIYKIKFFAKQDAEFAVIGDGSTDVDIFVYDEGGKLVAKDDRLTDLALVRWVPNKTQVYTIKVSNLHAEENTCVMGHN